MKEPDLHKEPDPGLRSSQQGAQRGIDGLHLRTRVLS